MNHSQNLVFEHKLLTTNRCHPWKLFQLSTIRCIKLDTRIIQTKTEHILKEDKNIKLIFFHSRFAHYICAEFLCFTKPQNPEPRNPEMMGPQPFRISWFGTSYFILFMHRVFKNPKIMKCRAHGPFSFRYSTLLNSFCLCIVINTGKTKYE